MRIMWIMRLSMRKNQKAYMLMKKNPHGHSNGYPVDCYDYLSTCGADKEGEDFTRSDGNLDRRPSPHRL